MSREVDERIVRLEFENKGFEKNAKKSSSTLEKLKAKMDFRKEAKSMDDAFDGKRFNVFVKGLDKVKASFTSLEAVAFSTINNITNRMVDASIKMVKSLSIDNVASGWQSYNSLNETRAALKAQGYEAAQVGKALDKLKWFSDETSYSMNELTKQMNSFIGTGRSMEESIDIVMGIAGAAAMASQRPEKAFNVMTQMAQEAGRYISGNTWQSVRSAGLNNADFKKNILKAAYNVGELTKLLDGTYVSKNGVQVTLENFENVLTKSEFFNGKVLAELGRMYSAGANEIYDAVEETGEMTYQVMKRLGERMDKDFGLVVFGMLQKTRSLQQAIEATQVAVSGYWTEIFKRVFGDEEEATTLWSDLAEKLIMIATGPFDKWLERLDEWVAAGGRDDLFGEGGALWNLIDALETLKNVFKDAFSEVFNIQWDLKGFTSWLKDFTSNLILSDEAAENLKTILKGVFSVVKIVWSMLKVVWELIKIVWPYVQRIIDFVVDILVAIADGLSSVSEGTGSTPFEKFISGFKNFIMGLWQSIQTIAPVFGNILEWFGDAFMRIGETFKKIFSGENQWLNVKDLMSVALIAGAIALIFWIVSGWISWSQTLKELTQSVSEVFNGISFWLKANALKNFVNSLILLIAAIAIIGSMDSGVIAQGLGIVGLVLGMLFMVLVFLNTISRNATIDGKGESRIVRSLLWLDIAIAGVLGTVALLKHVNPQMEDIGKIGLIFGALTLAVIFLGALARVSEKEHIDGRGMKKVVSSMITIEIAILGAVGLIQLVKSIGIEWKDLGIVGAIFGSLLLAVVILSAMAKVSETQRLDGRGIKKVVSSMLTMEIAILGAIGLIQLVKSIGIEWKDLGIVGAIFGVLLAAVVVLSAFATVTDKHKLDGKSIKKIVSSILTIEIAMLGMIGLIQLIKHLNIGWNDLGMVGSIFGALMAAVVVLSLIAKSSKIDAKNVLTILASLAVVELALAGVIGLITLMKQQNISWDDIKMFGALAAIAGIAVAVAAGLTILFGALQQYSFIGIGAFALFSLSLVLFAAGLLAVVAALAISVALFNKIAKIDWDSINNGFKIIMSALGMLSGAVAILTLLTPFITLINLVFMPFIVLIMLFAESIVMFSSSVTTFIKSLTQLSDFDFGKIFLMLLKLAGFVLILGALSAVFTPISLGIITLSTSISVLAGALLLLASAGVALRNAFGNSDIGTILSNPTTIADAAVNTGSPYATTGMFNNFNGNSEWWTPEAIMSPLYNPEMFNFTGNRSAGNYYDVKVFAYDTEDAATKLGEELDTRATRRDLASGDSLQ